MSNYIGLESFAAPSNLRSIDSLIAKVKQMSNQFALSSWIVDYVVPTGTVPSDLEFVEALKEAIAWKDKQGLLSHPAVVVSNCLETKDISITVDEMIVHVRTETEDHDIRYEVDESYYVLKGENNNKTVINAQVSDYLAYGCRVLKDYSISNSFPSRNCKTLGLPYAEFVDVMSRFVPYLKDIPGGGVRSANLVRDALYTNFDARSGLSIYLWALFNERTKCGVFDQGIANIVQKTKATSAYLPDCKGFCHLTTTLNYPLCDEVDMMYKLYNAHNQLRGEESGLGSLSSCYYWNSIPKAVAATLTRVVEILEICTRLNTTVVTLENGYMTEYEKGCLVANGIVVIDGSIKPPYTGNEKPNVYGSTTCPSIYFFVRKGKMPKIKATVVEHLFNPQDMTGLLPKDSSYFIKVFIHSGLSSFCAENGLNLYPSYFAAKPEVFVTNEKPYDKALTLEAIVQRCVKANHYRTMYPYNRLPFVAVDEYRPACGVSKKVILTRRGGKEVKIIETFQMSVNLHDSKTDRSMIPKSYAEFVDNPDDQISTPSFLYDENVYRNKFLNDLATLTGDSVSSWKENDAYKAIAAIYLSQPARIPVAYKRYLGDKDIKYLLNMNNQVVGRILDSFLPPTKLPDKVVPGALAPVVINRDPVDDDFASGLVFKSKAKAPATSPPKSEVPGVPVDSDPLRDQEKAD